MGKKKQKQGRPHISDVSAVKKGGEYVVSRSYAEVVDLISEGEIEGLVSGTYSYEGDQAGINAGNNPTGYKYAEFTNYTATGDASTPKDTLGFLRSIYWNNVPVVDKDGYYNFASVNVDSTVGLPAGHKPTLNTDMNNYTGLTDNEVLDLSVYRSIGERLYGPEIEGGNLSPTNIKSATLKSGLKIDKYSKTYSILNKECSKIELRIKVAALFEQVQAGPKTYKKNYQLKACASASTGYGDMKARTIAYNVYYQPIFDDRFVDASSTTTQKNQQATNKWMGPIRETVTGKVDSPYLRTTSIPPSGTLSDLNYNDLPGFEGWRIRIVRTTPESLTSFLKNSTFVDSLTEVYGTTLLYPYSSMIYSQFDARSFSRIPSRAYDAKLIKVKVPNNYDPVLKTYGKSDSTTTHRARTGSTIWSPDGIKNGETEDDSFWDGEFKNSYWLAPGIYAGNEKFDIQGKYFREWTDNPAWCFYDLLTNPRYGLGEYIKENEIDKWALYEIAQYCDVLVPDSYGSMEPRFTINYAITGREEAYKVMNDLASIFRGMTFYANGSIFAVQDKYKKAVYQFNNSNVVDGNFTYASSSKKARHTVAIVRYNDKKDLFQPALEYVENEEAVRRYGIREIETTALGCTSRGQARRFAQWILASEADETETVTFSAGQEGAYLQPGDVVQIYDNFRSPLKYSGRTNAVVPGVKQLTTSAPFPTSPDEMIPASGNNFNSIILDQALNFTSDNLYKFSILTPTYNYDANTTSLNTTDEKELRRSQIQNLVFSGAHVRNVTGSYRSDYMEGGSGVCTQIFFNTGTLFGGSGNALNFDDYVITGYTNTGVATSHVSETDHSLIESYSGGCFSGENLIWSIEPDNSNDTEFVSGNFSNYRLINIKENEGNTYDVSALAYSTGKYNKIENAVKLGGENLEKLPIFNTGLANDTTVTTANAASFSIEPGEAYSETKQESNYATIDIEFSAAGYERREDKSPTASEKGIKDPNDDFQYIICKFDYDSQTDNQAITVDSSIYRTTYLPSVVETVNGLASADNPRYKNNQFHSEILIQSNNTVYYIVIFAISAQGVLSQGFGKKINLEETATGGKRNIFSIVDNILINNLRTQDDDGGARRAGTDGLASGITIEAAQPGFTWDASVKGILSAPPSRLEYPSYPLFVPQDSTEYRITIRKPSSADSPNKPSNTIYVEITGYTTQSESPSFVFNEIYNNPQLISGVADDGTTPTGYLYDPHVTGWKNGKVIDDWTQLQTPAWKDSQEAEWLSISGSGFNIANKPNSFPLRKHDIVIEAHDGEGNTSAGNKLYQGTLFKAPEDSFKLESTLGIDKTYDILGVNLAAPESVMYTQITGAEGNWNKKTQYLSPENAYLNNLPYLAQAYIYPDGWLQTNMLLSQSTTGTLVEIGGVAQDEQEVEKRFNNAEGMVYYYTTGDNSVTFVDQTDDAGVTTSNPQLANSAPAFNLDLKDTFLDSADNAGTVQQLSKNGEDNIAFGGIVNAGKAGNIKLPTGTIKSGTEYIITVAGVLGEADNDFEDLGSTSNDVGTPFLADQDGTMRTGRAVLSAPQGNVHRGFYLFSDSDSMEALRIPFPDISRPLVQNIQLSYALFDGLHLLSAFESDGATPKTTTKNTNDQSNVRTVKNIFTEKNMNFSQATAPLASDIMMAADTFNPTMKGVSQSIYLTESSVQSAGDAALGFRAWGVINISIDDIQKQLSALGTFWQNNGNSPNWGFLLQPNGKSNYGSGTRPHSAKWTEDFKDRIQRTTWTDGRSPATLKTFTLSDIESISIRTGVNQLVSAHNTKQEAHTTHGDIALTLRLPSAFDSGKLGIIAQAAASGWDSGYTYSFEGESLKITYSLSTTERSDREFGVISLFFGILATNE